MMKAEFNTNAKAVAREIRRIGRAGRLMLARALYVEGEKIMTTAKTGFVPVKDGHLRGSGHVMPPVVGPQKIDVFLGFGGPAADYAIHVHERTGLNHPVGQDKYLEVPTMAAVPGMGDRVRASVLLDLHRLAASTRKRSKA